LFYYYLAQPPAVDRPRRTRHDAPAHAWITRRAHPRSRRAAIPVPAGALSNAATAAERLDH